MSTLKLQKSKISIRSMSFVGLFFLLSACSSVQLAGMDESALKEVCENPALRLAGQSQRTVLGAGYKAIQSQRLDCAENLLLQAQTMDPQDPYAALNLGVVYQMKGRMPEARVAYERAMRLDGVQSAANAESVKPSTEGGASVLMPPGEIARRNLALIR